MEKKPENVAFGKRVAFLRQNKAMSQERLALECGINRTFIGEIERGEKTPSLLTIIRIAKGLDINKSELMDY
ncbi:MAG: helix-turn-helix domain-containing protein [Muribaculaceae bacterium]|nr:helix-turn-helix domain-containing protein [Muribaculaceae bacterium]